MKIVLLLLFLVASSSSYACFTPIKGDEYDSQVVVVKLGDKNHYQVTVPRYMKDMPQQAEIILAYTTGTSGGIPIYQKNEMLKAKVVGDKLVATFKVVKQKKQPYLVVMWWPEMGGMCGIQANTPYLVVE